MDHSATLTAPAEPPLKFFTENDFRLLCRLLQEEEGRSLETLCAHFRALMKQPFWKRRAIEDENLMASARVRELVHEAHFAVLEDAFRSWQDSRKAPDLEKGLYLLSSFEDMRVTPEQISGPLDRMAQELNPLLHDIHDYHGVISVLRHYLFDKKGFHGNTYNYYDPQNSYLHQVLQSKAGIPISLSSICILMGQRVRWNGNPLPIVGIGLPSHFIVQFRFPDKHIFFDPFNQGRVVTRKDCIEILKSQGMAFKDSYLEPVDSGAVLCRAITNLLHIYSSANRTQKRTQLFRLLQILNGEEEILVED